MLSSRGRVNKTSRSSAQPRARPQRRSAAAVLTALTAASSTPGHDADVDMPDTDAGSVKQEDFWLRIVLDYGTKNQSATLRIISASSPPATAETISEPAFLNQLNYTPQIIGFQYGNNRRRRVLWGTEVLNALSAGHLDPEDTIEMWKLALYKSHSNSAMVTQIEDQMVRHGLDIVSLTALHLEHMLLAIREELKRSITFSRHNIDELPIELWITVPQMWEAPACQKMILAAKKAAEKTGVKWVKLVFEAECATAWHLHTIKDSLATGYSIGDEIIVCDIGGATGDLQRVVYASDPRDGAKVLLRNVGESSGDLCGSEFVNEAFREWLKTEAPKQKSTFAAMCKKLGLSQMACLRQASDASERIKKTFTGADHITETIVIRGSGAGGVWVVDISSKRMVKIFEHPVRKIKLHIERLRNDRTVKVIITGRFGRSQYLIKVLKEHFEDVHVHKLPLDCAYLGGRSERAVSNGGMMRWREIETAHFDKSTPFGIGQEEIYDPKVHKDAEMYSERVLDCDYSNDKVVACRWLGLVNQHTLREGEAFTAQQ